MQKKRFSWSLNRVASLQVIPGDFLESTPGGLPGCTSQGVPVS